MENTDDYRRFCGKRYSDIYAKMYEEHLHGRKSDVARKDSERLAQHDAILLTFEEAYRRYEDIANAAQIWNAIYNAHLRRKAKIENLSELDEEIIDSIISGAQSWKKCSGHVFEDYIVQSTKDRLKKYHIRFVY